MIYFQVSYLRLKRKENSLKTIYLFFWITQCKHYLLPFFEAIVVQEFWPDSLSLIFMKVFNLSLRIDSPIFNYCFYGTFLHFSLQVLHNRMVEESLLLPFFLSLEYLLLLPRSVLITISYKITLILVLWSHLSTVEDIHCSLSCFLREGREVFSTASPSPQFQRHPFSGLIHSAGELLHTP